MTSSRGEQQESHTYPPSQPHSAFASASGGTEKSSSNPILRFAHAFAFRRERSAMSSASSSNQANNSSSGADTSPQRSTSPTTASSSHTGNSKSRIGKSATKPKPSPPIVVPSWRYKAEVQDFTVRVENEFIVDCTIVTPVPRFPFLKWPGFLKFNTHCFGPRAEKGEDAIGNEKKNTKMKKGKRKSRGGVAVEHDSCDDMSDWSLVEPSDQAPAPAPVSAPKPPQPQPRQPRPQSQSRAHAQEKERLLKATRRNSGWAGVFSATAWYPIPSSSSGSNPQSQSRSRSRSGSRSRDEEDESAGFTIDRNSKMLVVPDVDIGVARVVKQEIEKYASPEEASVRLVRPRPRDPDETLEYDAFGRNSHESWLDF